MALKKDLTKAEYDNLPEAFRSEYKAKGEGFTLDIEGDDGIDWRQKREIEAEHRRKAEDKAKAAQDELDNMRRGAIPKNDVEALEKSWQAKVEAATNTGKARETELLEVIAKTAVQGVATEISQMFLAPTAMVPMITARLKSEIVNGVATTRVLDKMGQLSALTVDDLKKEFQGDPALAAVIVGSKGSGGGAGGSKGGGGNPGAGGKKLKDLNEAERTKLYRENKQEFDRLVAEDKQSRQK